MNNYFFSGLFLIFIFHSFSVYPQDQKKYEAGGYVSNLASFVSLSPENKWDVNDLLNSRLNTAWYPSEALTCVLQMRNQFLFGQAYSKTNGIGQDRGLVDLNFSDGNQRNFLWRLQIDRLYTEYSFKKCVITIGRQRINWGRTLVWNPNDIFNSSSFYDFDYVEKPGSDAFRFQYYSNEKSTFELVVSADSSKKINTGVLAKSNFYNTDFQLIVAYLNQNDLLAGAGWEGNIGKIATRGELAYYYPMENKADTTGILLASIGFDYLVGDKLNIQFEFLYNDKKTRITNLMELYQAPASTKSLSLAEYNSFIGLNCQINPIVSFNLSGMYYSNPEGFFLMPSLQFSLTDNLSLGILYQYFNLDYMGNKYEINYLYGNLKWSF